MLTIPRCHTQAWKAAHRLRKHVVCVTVVRRMCYAPCTRSPIQASRSRPLNRRCLSASTDLPESITKEVRERAKELQNDGINPYPRYAREPPSTVFRTVRDAIRFHKLRPGEELAEDMRSVGGRITSIRTAGSKLAFIDLREDLAELQIVLESNHLEKFSGTSLELFRKSIRLLRRGDYIKVSGRPYLTSSGQESLRLTELPILQAPCLQRFPVLDQSKSTPSLADDHVTELSHGLIKSKEVLRTLHIRSLLLNHIRSYLLDRRFYEVTTPIISTAAGGATARPFEITATEFPDRKLALRVAPELWLKRLIVSGMTRIFEIGPCFRNEGVDRTHNPEFTSCEFYAADFDLSMLMEMTEAMLLSLVREIHRKGWTRGLADHIAQTHRDSLCTRIDFIPALNASLGIELPNLMQPFARDKVMEIFREKQIPIPEKPTLPRLLDKLSSHYLEPQCGELTWIMNIPRCMSPLSKSFIHPTAPNNQEVAARAELFIRGQEVVNCYEEENDPFLQREKFQEQQRFAHDLDANEVDDEAMKVDEDYIRALEWGLPPTGGWGCGIDRLVMLFADKENIASVLSHGNLRHVAKGAERRSKNEKRLEQEKEEAIEMFYDRHFKSWE